MHYGDKEQLEAATLEVVVYKHSTWNTPGHRQKGTLRTKAGFLRRDCVSYEVANVQEMKFFAPHIFIKIIQDPGKYIGKSDLDALPFEGWYKIRIIDLNGWGEVRVEVMGEVSHSLEELDRLH